MRSVVASLLIAAGCAGSLEDTGGASQPTGGAAAGSTGGSTASCGDGTIDHGEACDDGNRQSGDGCSAQCTVEASARVSAAIDRTSIQSELGTTETLNLTLTSVGGFAGAVSLTGSVDYDGAAGTWTVTPTPASISLTANQSAVASVKIAIPSDSAALSGTIKLAVSGSAVPVDVTSTVTAADQVTIVIPKGTGSAIPHAGVGPSLLRIRSGTKVIWDNQDTIQHVMHGSDGIPHEDTAAGQPGSKYTVTPSGNGTWYCHTHNESDQKVYSVKVE